MSYQPLFILAPPCSFASVTCAMVGSHPEMFGLAETNLFLTDTVDDLLSLYQIRPTMQDGLLRSLAYLAFGEQTEDLIDIVQFWLEENQTVTTGNMFKDICAWAAPRCVIDKSPAHVYSAKSLARIRSTFPEARYLHLLRHPRATCESAYKTRRYINESSKVTSRLTEIQRNQFANIKSDMKLTPDSMWLKPHLSIMEHLENISISRKITLRGEDFLSYPRIYLAQIAEWLGIKNDSPAIEAMLHPEQSPFACYGPNNARLGNGASFMKSPHLRPYQATSCNLEDPLSWDNQLKLSDLIKDYATLLGYG